MGYNYTELEKDALRDKINDPSKNIKCPRCGKYLNYREINNSCEVKCPTDNCLIGTVRGI